MQAVSYTVQILDQLCVLDSSALLTTRHNITNKVPGGQHKINKLMLSSTD